MADTEEVKKKGVVRDTVDSIVVAFVVAMIIRTFFMQAYKIPSGSMLETLQIGDHILVNKVAYILSEPDYDDIVVFEFPLEPDKDYIKRVIGVPGDTIKIENKIVHRNGVALDPDYVRFEYSNTLPASVSPRDNVAEFKVPEGSYFMMGDNRDASFDSRFWGFVDRQAIVGKAFIIYWSWDSSKGGFAVRANRLFNLL